MRNISLCTSETNCEEWEKYTRKEREYANINHRSMIYIPGDLSTLDSGSECSIREVVNSQVEVRVSRILLEFHEFDRGFIFSFQTERCKGALFSLQTAREQSKLVPEEASTFEVPTGG